MPVFLLPMKRFTVPLEDNLHLEIKVKATVLGLPMTEIMRRLLVAWLRGDVALPDMRDDEIQEQA